ncbi:MAG: lysine--tRNA ligase [Candidatus Bathyarchaeota archaeon]
MSLPSHWIDKLAADIEKRGDDKIVFSTAKTPSGPIHVGIGRELVYCSVFERLLRERGHKTEFLFFIDDFDSLKSFPPTIPEKFTVHKEFLGRPMYNVPCPFNDCESWSKHYAQELTETFPSYGLHPRIIRTHDLYQTPEMKNIIRTSLERVDEIRKILREITGSTLTGEVLKTFEKDLAIWYPCLVLCEKCGKLKTGKVTGYNSSKDTVTYSCTECSQNGEVKIQDWPIKLRWRIDWPAKWAIFNVCCEPAGKDHCVKGGAYDTGEEICRNVFGWRGPYRITYEWILLGEHAMKTHKGISFTFKEWLATAPPEIYRYMILREDPRKHISFLPERMPQLIDEFERAERLYFDLEEPANPDERKNVKKIYPLSIPQGASATLPVRLPYRFAVILTQLGSLLGEEKILLKSKEVAEKLYSKTLLTEDEERIKDRLNKAAYWVKNYAPSEIKIEVTESVSPDVKGMLQEKEKEALKILIKMLTEKEWNDQQLQFEIFEVGKRIGIGKKIFAVLYLIFFGKKFGPRLAPFLLSLEKELVIKRLTEAVE